MPSWCEQGKPYVFFEVLTLALLRVQVFLGCDTVLLGKWSTVLWRIVLSCNGTKVTYHCKRIQHDFLKPWAPLIHRHNITSPKTAALLNLTTWTQILSVNFSDNISTFVHHHHISNNYKCCFGGRLWGQQLFWLTNSIPHAVCRYVCGQLFVRTCMPSSSDSFIITIEPNDKENFWTAALLFYSLQKEKNIPEQNLHIFWNILRSDALSLLPYQFSLLHVFSIMVVGWHFLIIFIVFLCN